MSQLYDTAVTTLDGQPQTLGDYAGKVLLVVNVASQCGLTPQYEQLEQLYQEQRDAGLAVLGFPCNQFGAQEPGSEQDIQQFCQTRYGIQFPMFSKIEVNGPGRHPLYQQLIEAQPQAQTLPDSQLMTRLSERGLLNGGPSDIAWNFEKFLVDRNGVPVARFAPDMPVNHPAVRDAIENALAA